MNYKHLLSQCFKSYFQTGKFFNSWFKEYGNAYYFTFKQNLSRTNIQYGELKSLIKSNLEDNLNTSSNCKDFQLLTIFELIESINSIISSFKFPLQEYRQLLNNESKNVQNVQLDKLNIRLNEIIENLISNYSEILSRTVIIDPFHNSCSIYLPPNLSLNLFKIIANSGYINTCGELVYGINFKKAEKEAFFNALEKSIRNDTKEKFNFNVFSHEDFEYTANNNIDIEHLKLHIDKYYFDGQPLISILFDLRERFENSLNVRFSYNHSLEKNIDGISYWMVKDTSIDENIKIPGKNNYFICYKQLFKNDNQLHIFNENKPAWKSNTNIPHTLIGAMLNIALEGIDPDTPINIIDPFSGTGTTVLELIKLKSSYNLNIFGSDMDCLYEVLLHDNLLVISMTVDELDLLLDKLSINEENFHKNYSHLLKVKEEFNLSSGKMNEEFEIEKNKIEKFKKLDLSSRLLIYTYFLVRIAHTSGIERKQEIFENHYKIELNKLWTRLNELKETISLPIINNEFSGFLIVKGKFSSKVILDPKIYKTQLNEFSTLKNDFAKNVDFREIKKEMFDIIICDPPYGLNAHHNIFILQELYKDLPEILINSLKANGQIMLSLPDESYSGKHSPWFTHKEMVITRFYFTAQKYGKRMISYSEINPSKELFNAPYYWEAQRALRRSIIHLRFI